MRFFFITVYSYFSEFMKLDLFAKRTIIFAQTLRNLEKLQLTYISVLRIVFWHTCFFNSILIACRWWQEYFQWKLVHSGAGFIKNTNSRAIKILLKKTAKGIVQTSENICSGNVQQVCTLAPFISLHVFALFLCQWTLYFFATSFTHLVFISVVKFLHSCIGASGPDPFYAGHKHNIYDPKFSVNKCYISGQKMRETFFTSSSTFMLFHS